MTDLAQNEIEPNLPDGDSTPILAQNIGEEQGRPQLIIPHADLITLHQPATLTAVVPKSATSDSLREQTTHDDYNREEQADYFTSTEVDNLTASIDLSGTVGSPCRQSSVRNQESILTNPSNQDNNTIIVPASSMASEQFIMIFDSPERDKQDSRLKIEDDDVTRDKKIKMEPEEDTLIVTRVLQQRSSSPSTIKTEVEEFRAGRSSDHDQERSTHIQSEPIPSARSQEMHNISASTRAFNAAVANTRLPEQFTNHDLQQIFPAQACTSNKPPLVQTDNFEVSKSLPSPVMTPTSGTNNTVRQHDGYGASRSSSQKSRSTPETQRLSRLQVQLNQINFERDAEQARLDRIVEDLEEIKTRTRLNQRLVEDSQAQVKACKTEVAEAHTKWKQAQTKFKQAKDNSLELSDKTLELVKERSEKADRHEKVLDRLTDVIARRNQLKNRISIARELAEISQEFTDQETKDFVRRVRNLPKIRVKTERDAVKDEESESDDVSTALSSNGDVEEFSDDDAEIIDWHNLGGDSITFNQINHLRDRLNMVKSEPPLDQFKDEPSGQDSNVLGSKPSASSNIKAEPQDFDALSTQHGISRSSQSLLPSKMSLADIRAHVDQIVYHKEQLDKYLDVARGSKRTADDMKVKDHDGDDGNSTSSDSDDESVLETTRARKRRMIEEPVNYLENWK